MQGHSEIVRMMHEELARLQSRNPSFSLRAFARRLQLQPSAVSEIMSGKRLVTRKMGERILARLDADPDRKAELASGLRGRRLTTEDSAFMQLETDRFRVISDWWYFAILSLAETRGFKGEPEWISRRLNIPAPTAASAVERLLRLGLLRKGQRGRLVPTGAQLATTNDVADSAIQRQHRQSLELAGQALDRVPVERRDYSAMTMAVDPTRLTEAKARIRKFRRELCAFLEGGRKKEVFRVSIQLFPLSNDLESQSQGDVP